MSHNTIIILSESSSLYESLETSSVESSGSGRRQILTKPVMSSNESSTFRPHCNQMTRQKHCRMAHLIHVQEKNNKGLDILH